MNRKSLNLKLIPILFIVSNVFAQEKTVIVLDEVSIEAKAFQESEGGIADGFLVNDVNLGPMGNKKAIDVPYSINTIPKEIIKNQRSTGLEDVVKYIPSAQIEYRGGGEVGRPQTRGMRGDVVANSFWDGFHVVSTTATPMIQFDSLQIQNGLAGSLYGAQNPSGIYNFILKRPTKDFYNSIMVSYYEKENAEVSLDIGGRPLDFLGYRANILYDKGEGYVSGSDLERKLASLGLDFYITDKLTLETNMIYYNYVKEGYAGSFNMPGSNGVASWSVPDAVDASKRGLGQKYAGVDLETKTASAKLKYEIADDWYAETGYLFQRADRSMYGVTNAFTSNNGDYRSTQTLSQAAGRFEIDSWLARVNTKQTFFGAEHDISLGGSGYIWSLFGNKAKNSGSIVLGNSNIKDPTVFSNPGGFTNKKDYYQSGETIAHSMTLADSIKFNENWEMMLSISESWVSSKSYNTKGVKTSSHSDNGESYAASIMYKPDELWSIYFTYADSLQAGSSGTNSDNSTVTLKPHRSKQYEIGTKFALDSVDLSFAAFQIERPIAYQGSNGKFEEQGDQKNRGLEFMTSGKLTNNLSLFGGVTYIDGEIKGAKSSHINNKQPIGIPEWQANMLFEYNIPSFEELVLSSNFHYTGKRAIDQANTEWADGYFTMDLGLRYATKKLIGERTIFRFSVNNVTNEKYWAGIFNSNGLDGVPASGTSMFLGEPRTVVASIEVRF